MAYVADRLEHPQALSSPYEFADWHLSQHNGDYILLFYAADGGESITISSGWTQVYNSSSQSCRFAVWYRKNTGTYIDRPTLTKGGGEQSVSVSCVIRDADATTFLEDSSTQTGASSTITAPGLTSATSGACIVRAFGSDKIYVVHENTWGETVNIGESNWPTFTSCGAYQDLQVVTGAVSSKGYRANAVDGWQAITLAIKNKSGGGIGFAVSGVPTWEHSYIFSLPTFTSLHNKLSTIDGVNVYSCTGSAVGTQASATANGWAGFYHSLPSVTDYTVGYFHLRYGCDNSTSYGSQGMAHYFEDTSGNWVVLSPPISKGGLIDGLATCVMYTPDQTVLDESVVSIDWSDVTIWGYAWYRANTDSRVQYISSNIYVTYDDVLILAGGNTAKPITFRDFTQAYQSARAADVAYSLGSGQNLLLLPIQIGDGINETHFSSNGESFELAGKGSLVYYDVPEDTVEVLINLSADCSVDFSGSLLACSTRQKLTIDALSSSSASYNYAGTFTRWKITFIDGLEINNSAFILCDTIIGAASTFDSLVISSSTGSTSSIKIDSGADITGSTFTKGSETYAIEITEAGNYDFSGNSYSGYSTNQDVYISATTGTVNITVGSGDVPEYTSAGATVNITAPTEALTIATNIAATIRYFDSGSQSVEATTSGTSLEYEFTDTDAIDIEVVKQYYVPVSRQDVTPYNGDYDIILDFDEAYHASHSLAVTTHFTYNRTTKVLAILADQSALDVRSALADTIRTNSSYYNTPLLMDVIGGLVRVDLINGMTCSDMSKWKGAGCEVYDAADATNPIEKWCAVKTVGGITGSTTHYRQTSSGDSTAVALTNNVIDEAFQYWDDSNHDGVATTDTSGYFLIKSFLAGSKQGRVDVLTASGDTALKSTMYSVGLANVSHDYAGTDPGITSDLTLVAGGTVSGKVFTYKIVDGGTNSGEDIADQLNYNAATNPNTVIAGGTGLRYFELPDMVIHNATSVETERGYKEGATPTLVGFYVERSGADHPDFTRFQADDGTYYVKPVTANIAITNLPDDVGGDTRLHIYNVTEDVVIYSGDPAGTGYSTSYTNGDAAYASSGDSIRIRFAHLNAGTSFEYGETTVTASTDGITADGDNFISEDSVYGTNAVDGSGVTMFTADYSGLEIEVATDTDFTAAQFYAYYCYSLVNATGITAFWGGITANDTGNYLINNGTVNMFFESPTGVTYTVKQTDSARIYRADGNYPVQDPTESGYGVQINWKSQVFVVSTGGSALTPSEQAQLTSVASKTSGLTYTVANELDVNVQSMNDAEMLGDGTSGDLWRGE